MCVREREREAGSEGEERERERREKGFKVFIEREGGREGLRERESKLVFYAQSTSVVI